jgi:RecA-family ATPase
MSYFEDLNTVFAWRPPNIPEIVGQAILLRETKLCVFAEPKLFKSIYTQQLGFCIATGTPWLGFSTTQSKVFMLQSEIPKSQFRNRLLKMVPNVPTAPNGTYKFRTDRSFKLDRRTYMRRDTPDVLIFDPWYKMLTSQDNQAYTHSQDVMDSLIDEFGVAIIMVHHSIVPQFDQSSGQFVSATRPRGPQTVEGWFDSIIQLKGRIEEDTRTLTFELRHAEKLQFPITTYLIRDKLWAVTT